jgi:multiple sugar transport system ATP-binding protein/inositol-phosphate transport system ATP-binding protein
MVFQNYALWPHMTVSQNVAFGLEERKLPRAEIARKVADALALVNLSEYAQRRPHQLSGGQQQRVALARTIAIEPQVLLLDEPLSNLDAKLRLETRAELKKLQRSLGVTAVYVTHDQEEAMTLADRMAVFMNGEIQQVGKPSEVFARPNSVEVAAFIGSPPMNLLPAKYENGIIDIAGHQMPVASQSSGPRDVIVGFRPSALRLARSGLPGTIELIEDLGDSTVLDLACADTTVRVRISDGAIPLEGDRVFIIARPHDIHLFDAVTGARI